MAKFTLTINSDNEAFNLPDYELARILRELSAQLVDLQLDANTTINLYDINGNHCGTANFDTEGA